MGTTGGGLFGVAARSVGGLFDATATAGDGLVGTAASSGGGLFGGTLNTGGGLFGATTTSGGLFGVAANTAAGLFGGTVTPGGGLFGATEPRKAGLFDATPPSPGVGLFGTPMSGIHHLIKLRIKHGSRQRIVKVPPNATIGTVLNEFRPKGTNEEDLTMVGMDEVELSRQVCIGSMDLGPGAPPLELCIREYGDW